MRRLPSGCTSSGTNAPSSRRARQIVTRRPCERRPRADVRRERPHAPPGVDRVGRGRARDRPGRSSRRRSRPPRAAARTTAPAAPRRAAARRPRPRARRSSPASSSGRIGNASCAAIGPASSAATVSWIVTPVSSSPARIARSTGAAPRQRGSSDGCTLSHSAWSSSACGIEQAVGADHDRVDRARRAAPAARAGGPGCRAARRPPSPAARRACARARAARPGA